ncbi:MAG: signal recognition particle protein [Candidatus Tectomicrobia bacterium]|nr:signal recognition particle protein [Candidatus Tectomicrobia bacterium]
MMFENLTQRLEGVFRKLRGRGKLTESDVAEALREVRLAFLEADVHFQVVKSFIAGVKERAVGAEVLKSLTPGQQVIQIVHEELVRLMGEEAAPLARAEPPPTVILLAGLHGSGKTTTAGKLAHRYRKEGRRPYLVPCDLRRPAAVAQLATLGRSLGAPVFDPGKSQDAVSVSAAGLEASRREGADVVILDSAGRLQIDEDLMAELREICRRVRPHERLLVADAMTGQQAVSLAKAFHEAVELTGVVLTKMDGDARGGAALSIRAEVGVPLKLVGVGERLEALEPFHPARMASRILGMGDVLSLIERAGSAVSAQDAAALAEKVRTDSFTLEDFRGQLRQIQKMGPLDELLAMIPGMSKMPGLEAEGGELKRVEAIISSMTPAERRDYTLINGSRRRRIAAGSGATVQDVNQLLKQFSQMKKMMKWMAGAGGGKKKRALRALRGGMPGLFGG